MKLSIRNRACVAFTLIEVVLAIAISIGLMFVALFFYSQSSNLRTQLIDESERIGTMRLLLRKMASDLRSAQAHDQFGFTGASNSIVFVKSEVLPLSSWNVGSNAIAQYPSGLAQITYQLVSGTDGTNLVSLGIAHRAQPLNLMFSSGSSVQIPEVAGPTNYVTSTLTNALESTNLAGLLTDKIHTLQFRYWDGMAWTNAWDSIVPPAGVEIILASDAPDPNGTNAEIFRRVVFLPGGAKTKTKPADASSFAAKF